MIQGYIRYDTDRVALFAEGMKEHDVLKCRASFYLNEVDEAALTLPGTNRPARSLLQKNAIVELRDDDEIVFIGETATMIQDEYGDMQLDLDGALGWLRCVVKPPFSIKAGDQNSPVANFLAAIISQYNAGVGAERMITLGAVTISGNVELDHHDEYTTMLQLLGEVREQLGGYVYMDYATGTPTLNYVARPTAQAAQELELGVNVLTVENQLDFSDYASRVYATGSYYVTTGDKREQTPLDAGYVVDAAAEALYGRVDVAYKSSTDMGGDKDNNIPDKTQQEAREIILAEAQAILDERKVPLQSLQLTATDLKQIGVNYRLFRIGTVARAYLRALRIDTTLAVRKIERDYIDRDDSVVHFGREAATISGASFGGGGSVTYSGGGSGGEVGPQGPPGPPGADGQDGQDGADGVSPTVTVTAITGGHRVTITDADGTEAFDVLDGSTEEAFRIYIEPDGTGWKLSSLTGNTWQGVFQNRRSCVLVTGDTTIGDRAIKPDYVCDADGGTAAELMFSWQYHDGTDAEGAAFILNVTGSGSAGTIRRVAASDIGTGGGGEMNVQSDWNQTDTTADDFIKNKPTIAQADWNQTNSSAADYIKNKPSLSLPAYTASDAFKKLRVNYNASALEWAADSEGHTIFFMNESNLTIDGAQGSDIIQAVISDFKSVYIVSSSSYTGGVKMLVYIPLLIDSPTRDIESVQFYRPTSTGIDVLTIMAGQSVATKTTIPFGSSSGSGNFVKITYNSNTTAVTHNGTAITGAQIKALLDQQDAGAIMVDTNGNPNGVYRLKNIYANGDVEFEGELGDVVMNVVVPAASSTGSATITRKAQVYYYLDGTTVKSEQTNYAVTGRQIQNATIDNGFAPVLTKTDSYFSGKVVYHFSRGDSYGLTFRRLDGLEEINVPWESSTVVTEARGYNTPYHVRAAWDSSANKYVLKRWKYGQEVNATYADLARHCNGLWLNGNLPVNRIVQSGGWITAHFVEIQFGSGGIAYVHWQIEAGSSSGVSVSRAVLNRNPVTIYRNATGLAAIEANMSVDPAWQLTGLDLTPFKRIKIYTKAAQKSGSTASASTTPSACLEMLLDPYLAGPYGGHYLASTVIQKSNDNNRLVTLTCAVSSDKTKFVVLRQTNLYGTGATNNNDVGSNVVRIEGYYD